MTADVELLPLPEPELMESEAEYVYGYDASIVQDYARACVEANTEKLQGQVEALKDALIAANADAEALRAEVERLKQMLGDCYVEAGADTDGNEPSRMYAQALSAVQDLRRDYDETLAEPDYKARAERLAEALRFARTRFAPYMDDTDRAAFDAALNPAAAQENDDA